FSRFGVAQIFATFAAPLVLWLFVRSQERGSPRGALAAGLGLGIGLQLYYAMTTIPIVLLGAFLHGVVTRRHRGRAAVSLLVLTFATAGAAYAPVLQYSRRHPEAFSERFRAVSAFHVGSVSELARLFLVPSESRPEAIRILKRNVLAHLAMFHVRGDSNGRHNLPGAPMLDPVSGALFALGFLWCLLRIGVGRYFLLLLWFGAMISAGILSVDWEAPQSARTIGLTPVVALMGGVVLAGAWQAVSGSGGSPSRRAAGAALVLVALGAAFVHTWHTYFDKQLRDPAVFAAFSAQETKIGEVVRDEARDADVYVPETLLGGPTETLLIGHPLKANPFERARDLPLEARGRKAIVFFHGHETETLELFQRYYPSVRPQPFGPPGSAPILFVARVSPAELESIRGWTLRYEPDRGHGVEETVRSTEWSFTSSPVPLPFTVHVKGTLRVERDGLYRLVLSGGKPLSLVMDGESLPTTSVVEANLARGSHTVQASFRVTTPSTTAALRWREPGSEREAAIPERNLYSPSLPFGGLLGSFYPRVDCEGTPSFRRIDAQVAFYFHLLPLERPFGVRWTGEVLAPE
ncbi:MAG TPA: hypothetical protein VGR00_01155, partial [Thermoanaerobaculia bacterium]|nr:hypothetical protein [Thermoanaerobaculia bacterium]